MLLTLLGVFAACVGSIRGIKRSFAQASIALEAAEKRFPVILPTAMILLIVQKVT